jgi:hypothetical protein
MAGGIQIERSKHAQEFVVIGNAEARDRRLSFRARGLHHHLLSLPPGWRTDTTKLAEDHPEGRDAIRTALNELIKFGYVTKDKRQGKDGRWSTTMTVHDKPQGTEDGIPGVGEPGVGDPGANKKTGTKTEKKTDSSKTSKDLKNEQPAASGLAPPPAAYQKSRSLMAARRGRPAETGDWRDELDPLQSPGAYENS